MRRTIALPVLAAALSVGAVAVGSADATPSGPRNHCSLRDNHGNDLAVVGLLSNGKLICFETDRTRYAKVVDNITGLVIDSALVGIDYRPATNVLYGLGNAGGVYTINAATAAATYVSRLNVALSGTEFGVDFNPTVDRLRIVSDSGQNLRVNVDTGATTVDGTLNVTGPPVVNPVLGVSAAAYTNNDGDATTATTLFDLDATNDNTVVQAPANSGSLSPTGKLGVDAVGAVGFDIYTVLRNGTTHSNRAYASIRTPDGFTNLYAIDLLIGRATRVGSLLLPVVDIAIPTDQR